MLQTVDGVEDDMAEGGVQTLGQCLVNFHHIRSRVRVVMASGVQGQGVDAEPGERGEQARRVNALCHLGRECCGSDNGAKARGSFRRRQ